MLHASQLHISGQIAVSSRKWLICLQSLDLESVCCPCITFTEFTLPARWEVWCSGLLTSCGSKGHSQAPPGGMCTPFWPWTLGPLSVNWSCWVQPSRLSRGLIDHLDDCSIVEYDEWETRDLLGGKHDICSVEMVCSQKWKKQKAGIESRRRGQEHTTPSQGICACSAQSSCLIDDQYWRQVRSLE